MGNRAHFHRFMAGLADYLAQAGEAVVSKDTETLIVSIERRLDARIAIPSRDSEAVLYAIYSGAYGDYHRARAFA
jgi:hypothetical protein